MQRFLLIMMMAAVYCYIGCAPSISRSNYLKESFSEKPSGCNVVIQKEKRIKSDKGTVIGTMKIGDTGFSTNCGEDDILKIIRSEACKIGADAAILYEIRQPDLLRSCYRASVDFVKLSDPADSSKITTDAHYADDAVAERVQRKKALQVVLCICGAALGFIVGFMLFN